MNGGGEKKKKESERERGIFVAGRMESKGDKAGLKVGLSRSPMREKSDIYSDR